MRKKNFLLILIFAGIAGGCKKNQPFISFTNQNYRLVGTWHLDEIFTKSNVSGYGISKSSSGSFYKPTVLKLNQDRTASLEGCFLSGGGLDSVQRCSMNGSWEASGDEIKLNWDGDNVYNPQHDVYTITYSSSKQLDISYDVQNVGGGLIAGATYTYRFIK